MCFFEFFPIFPWLWKKTKKTDGKIENKTVFFQAFKTLVVKFIGNNLAQRFS